MTLRSRQYGARDSETGWPAITYDESNIDVFIRDLGTIARETPSGLISEQRARMYTISEVKMRDQVIYDDFYWEIEDVPFAHYLLTGIGYYSCGLIKLYEVAP